MGIYSLIDCSEEHTTVGENFTLESGMAASVMLRCNWADRHALVEDILGGGRVYPNTGFLNPPLAASAAIKPAPTNYGVTGQSIDYVHALVTVNYSNEVEKTGTDLVSESLEPTIEFLTEDYRRFRWSAADGDPLLEGEAPGRQFHSLNLVRTLYNVVSMPAAVRTAIGGVNDAVYNSALLGLTWNAEELLYHPPNLSRVIKTDGIAGWTLTMKFSDKPEGWNKYWRAKTQTWEAIFLADGGGEYKSYPPKSFASILF